MSSLVDEEISAGPAVAALRARGLLWDGRLPLVVVQRVAKKAKLDVQNADMFQLLADAVAVDEQLLKDIRAKEAAQLSERDAEKANWAKAKAESFAQPEDAGRSTADTAADERMVLAAAKGDYAAVGDIDLAPQIVVFISSTFVDQHAERNYFQEFAIPDLDELCGSLGLGFQAIDLRWGVMDDKTDDHSTTDLCLTEIEKSYAKSAGAAFVFLSGERYGWRALPKRVPKAEMEALLARLTGRELIVARHWYREDSNATPPVYVLIRISEAAALAAGISDDAQTSWALAHFWAERGEPHPGAEHVLSTSLRTAVAAEGLDGDALERWTTSVTDKEVTAGERRAAGHAAAAGDGAAPKMFVVVRTLTGLAEAAAGPSPSRAALLWSTPIAEDAALLAALRARVEAGALSADSVARYTVPWPGDGLSLANAGDYVRRVCADLYARLASDAVAVASRQRPLSPLAREVLSHASLALSRSRAFTGREGLLESAVALARPDIGTLGIICGASGSGKTSLMCAAAAACAKTNPRGWTLLRACGTSAGSSSARELLHSLGQQLAVLAAGGEAGAPPVPSDFRGVIAAFPSLLASAAAAVAPAPLTIWLDSLDQLSGDDRGTAEPWRWLAALCPPDPPPNLAVVVSTLPDDPGRGLALLSALLSGAPGAAVLTVPSVAAADARSFLETWLSRAGRTLTPPQMASAVDASSGDGVTVLHLHLLYGALVKLRSFDDVTLPRTVPGLVHAWFTKLEADHGAALVGAVFGLLAASRDGLSERELTDVISSDDGVMGWKGLEGCVLQHATPPFRRVPPAVFKRLIDDCGGNVVSRGARGGAVLSLYHRQFWEVAASRYAPPESPARRRHLASLLGDYFRDALVTSRPLRGMLRHRGVWPSTPGHPPRTGLSIRALVELPPALLAAGRLSIYASEVATSLPFLEASLASGLLDDVLDSLLVARAALKSRLAAAAAGHPPDDAEVEDAAVSGTPLTPPGRQGVIASHLAAVSATWAVLSRRAHHLRRHPGVIFQTLANGFLALAGGGTPAEVEAVVRRMRTEAGGRPWLMRANFVSGGSDPCLLVIDSHPGRAATAVCLGPASAGGAVLLATCADGTARVHDADTGALKHTLGGHAPEAATAAAVSAWGELAVTGGGDGGLKLWDVTTGQLTRDMPRVHAAGVTSVAFLRVWPVGTDPGAGGEALRDTMIGLYALSGGHDRAVVMTSLVSGCMVRTWRGIFGGAVMAVAAAPGGAVAAASSADGTCALVSPLTGGVGARLMGHGYGVSCIALGGPHGHWCLSGSWDKTLRLYSLEGVTTPVLMHVLRGHTREVTCAAFVPLAAGTAGPVMAASACVDGTARVWDCRTGATLLELRGHTEAVTSVACLPTGFGLATAAADGHARLWDISAAKGLSRADADARGGGGAAAGAASRAVGHRDVITSLTAHPDGSLYLTTSKDKLALVWSADTGVLVTVLEGHTDWAMGGALAGGLALTTSRDATARLWRLDGSSAPAVLAPHLLEPTAFALSSESCHAVTGDWGTTVRVWATDGTLVSAWQGHNWWVSGAAFLPGGDTFVTISADKTTKCWTLGGVQQWAVGDAMGPLTALALSPDGRWFATGSDKGDGATRLYALDGDTPRSVAELPSVGGARTNAVAFSHSGDRLASAGDDGLCRVCDVATGALVHVVAHGGHRVAAVAWCPQPDGGALVATAAADGAVRLFSGATGEPAGLFPTERPLTALAWSPRGTVACGDDGGSTFVIARC